MKTHLASVIDDANGANDAVFAEKIARRTAALEVLHGIMREGRVAKPRPVRHLTLVHSRTTTNTLEG